MKRILVMDLGGQAALVAARKLRGACVFSRIVDALDEDFRPDEETAGIVIAGGEGYSQAVKRVPAEIAEFGVPVLALGPAALELLTRFGGRVGESRAFRQAELTRFDGDPLFDGVPMSERFYADGRELETGEALEAIGRTESGVTAAFRHRQLPLYGAQFYVEPNDPDGWSMLSNFAEKVCGCEPEWRMDRFCEYQIDRLRRIEGGAVIAVSGGVDSAVSAELMRRALGDRLKCVFIDTGLLRKGESNAVQEMFANQLRMDLTVVDAQDRVFAALRGVTDPVRKRQAIRGVLYDVLGEQAEIMGGAPAMVRGTVYTDVIAERRAHAKQSDRAAEPSESRFSQVIEPVAALFKEEVRRLAEAMELPHALVNRQPFPSTGLAQRIAGEVTAEKLNILREADAILSEEISSAGLEKRLYQYFCVLTDMRTRGFKGGRPVSEYALAIRAVTSHDAMSAAAMRMPYDLLERLVSRIVELPGVNRVVYDMTPTPVANVEWM